MIKTHCYAALVLTFATQLSAAVIGVDNVHSFDADGFMASGSDFDDLRALITDLGHTIVPLSSFGAADLAGLDGAILMNPFEQNTHSFYTVPERTAVQGLAGNRAAFLSDKSLFTDEDAGSDFPITFGSNQRLLENIVGYVAAGGVAFFADDGGGFLISNYNQMVAPYGIEFADSPVDGVGHIVDAFLPHPLTAGLTEVGMDFQLPITVSGAALDLTVGSGSDNILAVVPEPTSAVTTLLGLLGVLALRRS